MSALLDAAQARVRESPGASFWIREGDTLSYEHEPSGGGSSSLCRETVVEARHTTAEGRRGVATGRVSTAEELTRLWEQARSRSAAGPLLASPRAISSPPLEGPAAQVSPERARGLAQALCAALPEAVLQAVLVRQLAHTFSVVEAQGLHQERVETEELLVRAEARPGAVVEGARGPLRAVPLPVAGVVEGLRAQLETLVAPGRAPTAELPLVLRPPVSAAVLGGLAWMLGGDVARSSPALAAGAGKRLFPSTLTLVDLAPAGGRRFDDEGQSCAPLTLVEAGVLRALLHSRPTAAALSQPGSGRGFFHPELEAVVPSPLNLTLLPAAPPPLDRYLELTARVETFTTQTQPGLVSLIAGGWEVWGTQRTRVGPLELELPVSATLRQLIGVADDARWSPSFEGVLAPSLFLAGGWRRPSRGAVPGPLRYG